MGMFTRRPESTARALTAAASPVLTPPAFQPGPLREKRASALRNASTNRNRGRLAPSSGAKPSRAAFVPQSATRTWQIEAFNAFEATGEISYAFGLLASLISRATIFVGAQPDPNRPPAPVADVKELTPTIALVAQAALDRLSQNSDGGIPGLMSDLALNIQITGEAFLVQIPELRGLTNRAPEPPDRPEVWSIRSVEEITVAADGSVTLQSNPAPTGPVSNVGQGAGVKLPRDSYVGRIFKPSPRYSDEPYSSLKALLPLISELGTLNQMFTGAALSRLNAGILFLPDTLSASATPPPSVTSPFPTPPADTGTPGTAADPRITPEDVGTGGYPASVPPPPVAIYGAAMAEEASFEDDLIDSMVQPISDPLSASSVVPLIIRGPADQGEKIKHITLSRTYDEQMVIRSERLTDRIMQGLDLPKDVVAGLASLKYNASAQLEENLLRSHIEPMLVFICDALTRAYLRPYLEASNFTPEQAARITLWFDTSSIVARPNRSEEADSGLEKYAISMATWRRIHGFDESTAPTPQELVLRMLLEKGSITPELTESLMREMDPLTLNDARQKSQEVSDNPLPPAVAQALGDTPSNSANPTTPPPPDAAGAAALEPSAPPPPPPGQTSPDTAAPTTPGATP